MRRIVSPLLAVSALLISSNINAQEVIVDNTDPEFQILSGAWGPSANAGFFGTNSLIIFAGGGAEGRVRWTPTLPQSGIYQVDAWWIASGNRAQDATYEIVGATGTNPVAVDQTQNGSAWNTLGEFGFDGSGGEYVDLTDTITVGDFVSADAVRFTYIEPFTPSPCPVTESSIVSITGGGCGGCGGNLLPGTLEPIPDSDIVYGIHSDLPEKFQSEGVLYATVPTLPEDQSGSPLPLSVRQQVNNGFTTIDGGFEVFQFHISQPGDGSAPRRIVTWVENNGTEPVSLNPRQVIQTTGIIGTVHEMESTLGSRVLGEDWDTPVTPFQLAPGSGAAVAYSNGFAGFGAGIDANINCFGVVRCDVDKVNVSDPDPDLDVYVVAIPFTQEADINSTTPSYLGFSALEDEDVVDLTTMPTGCQLSRATGVFPNFRFKSDDDIMLDSSRLPLSGYQFQMAASQVQAVSCPSVAQTEDVILHPGYAPGDTVGNYMIEYRVDLHLGNSDPANTRFVDITFGKSSADVGLVYQTLVGSSLPTDSTLASQTVETEWAGPNQDNLTNTLFPDGPIEIIPCETKVVSLRFMVLGNASLPFQLNVEPAGSEPFLSQVDDAFVID